VNDAATTCPFENNAIAEAHDPSKAMRDAQTRKESAVFGATLDCHHRSLTSGTTQITARIKFDDDVDGRRLSAPDVECSGCSKTKCNNR